MNPMMNSDQMLAERIVRALRELSDYGVRLSDYELVNTVRNVIVAYRRETGTQ